MIWRGLASLASIVILLLLVLAGAVAVITGSERGTAWLAEELQGLGEGAVQLRGVSGTLRGGLRVQAMVLQLGSSRLSARDMDLRIRAAPLLRGRLVVDELRALAVEVSAGTDPDAPPGAFRMPTISTPWPVELREFAVGELVVQVDEASARLDDIRLSAELSGSRLTVHRLAAALGKYGGEVSGTAELVPELPLEAKLTWHMAESGLSAEGVLSGRLEELQINGRLLVPDPVIIKATVSSLVAGPRVNATADWEKVSVQVPALGTVDSTGGRLVFQGTLPEWQAAVDASLQGESLPPMQLRGRASGDMQQAVVESLRLHGGFGELLADGTVDLQTGLRTRLEVAASDVRTGAFRPGLDGRLSARLVIDTEIGQATAVQLRQLRGQLMGRPLSGQGDFLYRDGDMVFRGLALRAGTNQLRADGTLGERLSGRFQLDAPEPGLLWPELSGSLHGQATVAGTRTHPVLDIRATGDNLALAENHARRARLDIQVNRGQQARAQLEVSGIRLDQQQLGDFRLDLGGTLDSHRLDAGLTGPLLAFSMASTGRWTGRELVHQLQQADLSNADAGVWQMRGEPEIRVAATAASIGQHCWVQQPTRLCIGSASWSPGRWQLAAELAELDLQRFNAFLAKDMGISGMAAASLDLVSVEGKLGGTASWRQLDTTLYYTGGDEPLVSRLETATFTADIGPDRSMVRLRVSGEGGLRLAGDGQVTGPPAGESPVQGSLSGELPDIGPLLPLLAGDLDLADMAGRVTLDAAVTGTLGEPQLSGEARLSGGAVAFPALGVKLEDIDIALTGDGSETFSLRGTAAAGGRLELDGGLRPLDPEGISGWLRLRGDKLDAIRLTDRYLQASPDMTLRYAAGQLSVSGEVRVPRADIEIRQLPESAASPSPDAVVVDRETAGGPGPDRQLIAGELAVILGRDVRLKAFGLDTRLEGTVRVSQSADGEPLGYGVVRLKDGKFGSFGKELDIRRGTIGFSGPLDNPAVNLRAERNISWEGKNVTAGIIVTGTAARPQSRVFSEPAMSEADAISYLVSGRPMKSADDDDRSAISGAALALGIQQTSPLTRSVGSAVALDELGVEGGSVDETELVAGKQLSEDLYVRFAYGLFNRIGTVLARYKLSRNFSIEAASGEDQSLDLIYSVEVD